MKPHPVAVMEGIIPAFWHQIIGDRVVGPDMKTKYTEYHLAQCFLKTYLNTVREGFKKKNR